MHINEGDTSQVTSQVTSVLLYLLTNYAKALDWSNGGRAGVFVLCGVDVCILIRGYVTSDAGTIIFALIRSNGVGQHVFVRCGVEI